MILTARISRHSEIELAVFCEVLNCSYPFAQGRSAFSAVAASLATFFPKMSVQYMSFRYRTHIVKTWNNVRERFAKQEHDL